MGVVGVVVEKMVGGGWVVMNECTNGQLVE